MFDIEIKKLGSIKAGRIISNKLLIFCGPNNGGKTYATYLIYRLLSPANDIKFNFVQELVDEIVEKKEGIVDLDELIQLHESEIKKNIESSVLRSLGDLFSVEGTMFSDTQIKIEIKKELDRVVRSVKEVNIEISPREGDDSFVLKSARGESNYTYSLYGAIPSRVIVSSLNRYVISTALGSKEIKPFFLPAERAGINLFYTELNSRRTALLHQLQSSTIDTGKLINDLFSSRYSRPVADYIDYLNEMPANQKNISDYVEEAKWLESNILSGSYSTEGVQILFHPKETDASIPLHVASSTSKSLFGLWFYLKHTAKKGQFLIIDEPELNLHPENQIKLLNLLCRLSKNNLNVVISTHSDYVIRQVNNIALSSERNEGSHNKSNSDQTISKKDVAGYEFFDGKIKKMTFIKGEGLISEKIDQVITAQNNEMDKIYFGGV